MVVFQVDRNASASRLDAFLLVRVSAEETGRTEFAELVSHHVLGAEDLGERPTVVDFEGHADERGTRDYNIALGERRANAAKNYLASLGVDPSRIQVISYGKERPAEMGSTEEAYAKNRRAVTVVIAR